VCHDHVVLRHRKAAHRTCACLTLADPAGCSVSQILMCCMLRLRTRQPFLTMGVLKGVVLTQDPKTFRGGRRDSYFFVMPPEVQSGMSSYPSRLASVHGNAEQQLSTPSDYAVSQTVSLTCRACESRQTPPASTRG
jgi:hypothetical protein